MSGQEAAGSPRAGGDGFNGFDGRSWGAACRRASEVLDGRRVDDPGDVDGFVELALASSYADAYASQDGVKEECERLLAEAGLAPSVANAALFVERNALEHARAVLGRADESFSEDASEGCSLGGLGGYEKGPWSRAASDVLAEAAHARAEAGMKAARGRFILV